MVLAFVVLRRSISRFLDFVLHISLCVCFGPKVGTNSWCLQAILVERGADGLPISSQLPLAIVRVRSHGLRGCGRLHFWRPYDEQGAGQSRKSRCDPDSGER